jgi:hypothetical protein
LQLRSTAILRPGIGAAGELRVAQSLGTVDSQQLKKCD